MPLSLSLGKISFFRRKRPLSSLIILIAAFICLIFSSGMASYVTFLNVNFYRSIYDFQVDISINDRAVYNSVCEMTENCARFVTWREYCPYKMTGEFVFMNAEHIVLSDENFEELESSTDVIFETKGRKALLQNYHYDLSDGLRKIIPIEDVSSPIEGELNEYIKFQVVGLFDKLPDKYASGSHDATSYKLFFKQSEFQNYGENDKFVVRFACATDEERNVLKQRLAALDGAMVTDFEQIYNNNGIDFFERFVSASLVLFTPIFALSLCLFFRRDMQSRRNELNLLYSLGMNKGKLFAYILTEYFFLVAALSGVTAIISIVLFKALHFKMMGYYAPFYLPYKGLLVCVFGLITVAFLYSCFATIFTSSGKNTSSKK